MKTSGEIIAKLRELRKDYTHSNQGAKLIIIAEFNSICWVMGWDSDDLWMQMSDNQ